MLAVVFRLGVLSLLGAATMLGGVAIMLQGAWGGIMLILSGTILMAVPAALCATQFLCRRLYGPSASASSAPPPPEYRDAPNLAPSPKCSTCRVVRAWLTAQFHGNHLPFWELMGMRGRGTPPDIVVDAHVMITRTGQAISIPMLEDLYITEQSRIHDAFDLVHLVTGIKD